MSIAFEAYRKESDYTSDWNIKNINTLITGRGLLLIALLAFLFFVPVLKQTDIIAAVLTSLLSVYIVLACIFTVFFGFNIRKKFTIKSFQPESLADTSGIPELKAAVSKQPALFIMQTGEIYVPPGFYLELHAEFYDEGMVLSRHILSGQIKNGRILSEKITFPHRGYWKISRISLTLSDKLNLTNYRWSLHDNIGSDELRVIPVTAKDTSLPVISSSNRAGDTLPDLKEKNGDPYDLKAYHPSDGVKRILWKVYAKSGELISRHPEASMTPEGNVIVYSLAGKDDEEVCSSCLAYLNKLESLNLEIMFTCLGAKNKTADTSKKAEELMIDSVWKTTDHRHESVIEPVKNLINSFNLKSAGTKIDKIAVFCSKKFLSSENGMKSMTSFAEHLQSLSIMPFFCIVRTAIEDSEPVQENSWRKYFFNYPQPERIYDPKLYYSFLTLCRHRNWELEEEVSQ